MFDPSVNCFTFQFSIDDTFVIPKVPILKLELAVDPLFITSDRVGIVTGGKFKVVSKWDKFPSLKYNVMIWFSLATPLGWNIKNSTSNLPKSIAFTLYGTLIGNSKLNKLAFSEYCIVLLALMPSYNNTRICAKSFELDPNI